MEAYLADRIANDRGAYIANGIANESGKGAYMSDVIPTTKSVHKRMYSLRPLIDVQWFI
jgi:hypothetical protein